MSACNAHNQELQRKVSQLEKRNMWETLKWDSPLHFQTILSLRSPPLWLVLIFLPIHILPATHSSCLQPVADLYTLSVVIYVVLFSFFPVNRRSLMEQLRRLQALIMNTSNKPAQTGTCVLVCAFSRLPTNKQATVQPHKINNHSTNSPSCWAS